MLKSIVIQYAIVLYYILYMIFWSLLDLQFDEFCFIIYLLEVGIYKRKEVGFYLYYVCMRAYIYVHVPLSLS
jgi:hypothetical protein